MVTHIIARQNDLFIYKEVTLKLYSTDLKYRTRRKYTSSYSGKINTEAAPLKHFST
jgi:hypothetical protein